MSAQIKPPKCCFFNIKTATLALGIFHMVMSILLMIEYSLEVASGKGYCKDLSKDYYRIADVTTSLLLIIMLFVISFNLLFGVVKAYMFKCVLSCFKYIKASKRQEVKADPQAVEKVVLPSYEEALELPSKECPPPYVAV
ncbi:hypothetical protein ASZ78_015637 [Callipepla squamata]|uniref:Lysosomal-associated transmembrane protein 5 n=1 Tax=Callipepla squamata TaxID=9009 RepID=A0A226MKD8_CALSU|nr:hypothetical protein ASZ78_015637 [Callipepla squamata]